MAPFKLKKLIPALGLAVVIVGSVLTYNVLWGIKTRPIHRRDMLLIVATWLEDAIALNNQFRIDDKHYILLSDDLRKEYGLPAVVIESDVGEKIADKSKPR